MPAALVFVVVLIALALFQLALVCGAPIGNFAWGGQHRVLPTRLRIGSAVGIVLYAVFAAAILDRAGGIELLPEPVTLVGAWVVFGFLALSVVLNALSRSRPERYTMVPVTLALAVTSFMVAAG